MRKWLGFILLLGLLIFPAKAGAQNEIKFDTFNVELWSEFDQPSMLVIGEFVLSKEVPLPATVTMRFPKGANLMAVAVNQQTGMFNVNFEGPADEGDWQAIKMIVETYDPHRIEYYQKLTRDGKTRKFEYQWLGDYAVQNFNINLLVPSDSTDLITAPILSNTKMTDNQAFLTGSITQSGLNAGQTFNFNVGYARESNAVVSSGQSPTVQPSEPIDANTSGRVSIDKLPYVIGGVGVVLIVVALFFYWRSTQSTTTTSSRRRRRHVGEETSEGQAYCHECGARAHEGDHFCRTCGSRLRTRS